MRSWRRSKYRYVSGAGEAAVLYILGVPLYRFIRKTGLMDKLLGRG